MTTTTIARRYIYCPQCEGTFSATKGDYFMVAADHQFTCCNEPSWLCQRGTRFTGDGIVARTVSVGDLA